VGEKINIGREPFAQFP